MRSYSVNKIICLLFLLTGVAKISLAQQVEVITENVTKQNGYEGKSYLVVKSLTIKNFNVSAATNGAWFAKVHPNVVTPTTPSADQNFVQSESILVNGITTETQIRNLTVADKATSFSYADGLGRGIQNVAVSSSPNLNDQIQAAYFDTQGRPSRQYIPYSPQTGTTGSFRSNALNDQVAFYNTPPPKVEGDSRSYGEAIYENSPLNRAFETKAVGAGWTNKSSTGSLTYNDASIVRLWTVVSGLPYSNSTYPANTLAISQNTDEEGNSAKTYTDFLGRMIMKEVQVMTQTGIWTWAQTYYVYDYYGKPLFVITPEAASNLTPNQDFVDRWCFQYQYDEYQRAIGTKAPGAEWIYTIYDRWDRPVLTQDANQRAKSVSNDEWSFVKYDDLNRPILTGLFTTTDSRTTLTNILATLTDNQRYEVANPTKVRYTLYQTFPTTVSESDLLSIVYYDYYSFLNVTQGYEDQVWDDQNNSYSFVNESGYTGIVFNNVKDLTTGGKVKVLGSNPTVWLNSVTYYDNRYRPLQTIFENQFGKADRLTTEYDFAGKVLKTKQVHQNTSQSFAIQERYSYDISGRLLNAWHQINSQPEVLISSLQYNELGQVVKKKLHTTQEGALQSVDYRYNIRGWMTNMNYTTTDSGDPVDYFQMELAYNESQSGNDDQYNGLISGIKWKHDLSNKDRVYNFGYNKGAFASAGYKVDNALNPQTGVYDESISAYDKNGNIQGLARKGAAEMFGAATIDQLGYNYDGNRLTSVTDTAPTAAAQRGFTDGNTQNNDYVYDLNGNLIEDKNKGIIITYNHLDQPDRITFTADQSYLQYTYLAGGARIKETFYDGQAHTRAYAAGFTYIDGVPVQLAHSQGHVALSTGEYYYYLADHLGSPRVVLQTQNDSYQSIATLETANASSEAGDFLYYDEAVKINSPLFDHTNAGGTYYATRLNGTTNERFGLAKSLSVIPGDKLSIEVYAKYLDANTGSWTQALSDFIAAIAAGTAPPGTFIDGGNGGSTGGEMPLFINLLNKSSETGSAPKAYLNYLLFDRDFNLLDGGYVRLSDTAKENGTDVPHERLAFDNIEVKEAGYAYIYLSNENDTPVEVYFDDFRVEHTESSVVQINGFYPYGMPAYSWVREGQEETRAKFQGKEYEDKTGWHDFHARQYDGVVGRMWSNDPAHQFASGYVGMGNNPVNGIDPDGRFWNIVIGAVVGGVVNLAIEAVEGDVNDFGDGLEAFLIGAVQGALASVGTSNYGQVALNSALRVGSSQIQPVQGTVGNFNYSFSPTLGWGSSGLTGAANVNVSYRINDSFALNTGYSIGYGRNAVTNEIGWQNRFSGGLTFYEGENSYSYYGSYYLGGGVDQYVNGAGLNFDQFSFRFEDDVVFSDKYRTAALQFGWRTSNDTELYAGFKLVTGAAINNANIGDETLRNTKLPNAIEDQEYLGGYFYGGVNYKGQSYEAGINSPFAGYVVQKNAHMAFRAFGLNSYQFVREPGVGRSFYYRQGPLSPYSLYW